MEVCWVGEPSFDAFTKSRTLLQIPLIDPKCELRRNRWKDVIRWYGRRYGLTRLEIRPAALGAPPIFAVGKEAFCAAKFYATIEGRPLISLNNIVEAASQLKAGVSAGRPIIFAPRTQLTIANLVKLNPTGEFKFSLVTGFDRSALLFMAVKMAMLARRTAEPHDIAWIDELGGQLWCSSFRNDHQRRKFETTRVREILNADNDVLTLHVHGEGSHANLRDIVLCGATFEREQVQSLPVVNGCGVGYGSESRTCKRAQSPATEIRGFEELRAAEVLLLSCNGFSVSGELYPSTTSCVLSMADGYAAAIVCNDRAVPLSIASVSLTNDIVTRGGSITDVADVLNDEAIVRSNCAPWLTTGYPRTGRIDRHDVPNDGRFVAANNLAVLRLSTSKLRTTPIKVVDSQRTINAVSRGSDCLILSFQGGPGRTKASGRLADASKHIDEAQSFLTCAISSCTKATFLELGIDRVYGPTVRKDSKLREQLMALRELRLLVERSLGNLNFEIKRARETLWFGTALDLCITQSRTALSCWDQTLAHLLAGPLATGSFEVCLQEGYLDSSVTQDGKCPRCASTLLRSRLRHASNSALERISSTCVACGPRDSAEHDGLAISVTAPKRILPGRRTAIVVRISDPEDGHFENVSYFLAVHLRDKGSGRTIYSSAHACEKNEHVADINVPATITPDLHTLRVTVSRGMRVAHARLRIACVPDAFGH